MHTDFFFIDYLFGRKLSPNRIESKVQLFDNGLLCIYIYKYLGERSIFRNSAFIHFITLLVLFVKMIFRIVNFHEDEKVLSFGGPPSAHCRGLNAHLKPFYNPRIRRIAQYLHYLDV